MKVTFLTRFETRILAWFLDEAGHEIEGSVGGLYDEEEEDIEGEWVI
jgi:hypothetical protein